MEQPTFESLNSPWPKGEPNTGYVQYFIGNSYLANVGGGVNNVTFEPRCRNNWHIHHKQVHRHRHPCRSKTLARSRQRFVVPASDVS